MQFLHGTSTAATQNAAPAKETGKSATPIQPGATSAGLQEQGVNEGELILGATKEVERIGGRKLAYTPARVIIPGKEEIKINLQEEFYGSRMTSQIIAINGELWIHLGYISEKLCKLQNVLDKFKERVYAEMITTLGGSCAFTFHSNGLSAQLDIKSGTLGYYLQSINMNSISKVRDLNNPDQPVTDEVKIRGFLTDLGKFYALFAKTNSSLAASYFGEDYLDPDDLFPNNPDLDRKLVIETVTKAYNDAVKDKPGFPF